MGDNGTNIPTKEFVHPIIHVGRSEDAPVGVMGQTMLIGEDINVWSDDGWSHCCLIWHPLHDSHPDEVFAHWERCHSRHASHPEECKVVDNSAKIGGI